MIGDNSVDGAVHQPLDNARHILLGAQGRIDPGHGALPEHLLLGEGKILGAGFTGDGHPSGLGLADDVHAPGSGDVTDVNVGAGLLRQAHIPFHLHLLRNGGSAGQAQLLCHRPGVDGVVLYQILVFAVV